MNKGITAGSRVRCISSGPHLPIKEGRIYTVTLVGENYNIGASLRLKELPEGSFKVSRFELAR